MRENGVTGGNFLPLPNGVTGGNFFAATTD
jgi:hypothetical protein